MARHPSGDRAAKAQASRRSMRLGLIVLTAAFVAILTYAGVIQVRRFSAIARLPVLPTFSRQSGAIAEQLRERDRSARADPTSAAQVSALCVAYHANMFYDEADRCYTHLETLSPMAWRSTYYRALTQSERGSGGELAAAMRRVVAEAPDFGPAWLRLGDVAFKLGHYDQAKEAWRRASSLTEPEHAALDGTPAHVPSARLSDYASLGLARIALVQGDAEGARQILERVTSTARQFGPAFRLLGDAYAQLGRTADAELTMGRANMLPVFTPYADPLIDALARESRNSTFLLQQAAEADLAVNADWDEYLIRRALEFDPDNPDVVYKLGLILRAKQRNDEALALFQRYQQMVPEDVQGIAQIGSCLGDLGRFSEAESFLRRALLRLDDALTHYNLAFVLTRMGRLSEAKQEYELALQRDPNHVEARMNLAAVLLRQGNLDRAARELARVLEIEPENAGAHTNLGLTLAQQGHLDRAAREFQEALRINPQQQSAREALQTLGR
jgi:tetratricopeptide (TPR) repeat protein